MRRIEVMPPQLVPSKDWINEFVNHDEGGVPWPVCITYDGLPMAGKTDTINWAARRLSNAPAYCKHVLYMFHEFDNAPYIFVPRYIANEINTENLEWEVLGMEGSTLQINPYSILEGSGRTKGEYVTIDLTSPEVTLDTNLLKLDCFKANWYFVVAFDKYLLENFGYKQRSVMLLERGYYDFVSIVYAELQYLFANPKIMPVDSYVSMVGQKLSGFEVSFFIERILASIMFTLDLDTAASRREEAKGARYGKVINPEVWEYLDLGCKWVMGELIVDYNRIGRGLININGASNLETNLQYIKFYLESAISKVNMFNKNDRIT